MEKALKYKTELGFATLFLVALIYFWIGSSQNKRIAQSWHEKMLPIIKDNFCYVGMEDGRSSTNIE